MHARLLGAIGLAAALSQTAVAQPFRHEAPARPRQFAPRPSVPHRFVPLKMGAHTFYGKIVRINGTTLLIQTRRKALISVDATNVIAAGTYSAPLFVGKLVSVDGTALANGVYVANHISRIASLDALRADR